MKLLRTGLARLRALFSRHAQDRDMAEQIELHLELMTESNIAQGMSPAEARRAALRKFGGVEQMKEQCRDERSFPLIDQGVQDLRYGCRQLFSHPGFTAVAVLSLALGIGANSVIFSLVDSVLLKSLPVPNAGELILFQWRGQLRDHPFRGRPDRDPKTKVETGNMFSALAFDRFQKNAQALAALFCFSSVEGLAIRAEETTDANKTGQFVSGGYFAGLGLSPQAGRLITPDDDRIEAAPVAVLSDRYWRGRFNADPLIIGKSITVNNVPVTIIGIAPSGFTGILEVGEVADISLPKSLFPQVVPGMAEAMKRPGFVWWWQVMGRPKPGTTREQVAASLEEIFRQSATEDAIASTAPLSLAKTPGDKLQLLASDGSQGLSQARNQYAWSVLILFGLTGLVLLIACLNVANLLLARGVARRREIAVRLAIGAGRARLIRQLLTESLLLAGLGAALGTALAYWGQDLLLALHPIGGDSFSLQLKVDLPVLGFGIAVAMLTGILFGLAPALRSTRLNLTDEFHGSAGGFGSKQDGRLSKILMAAQVSLSLVLLVGCLLFARTLRNLHRADPGYNRDGLVLFGVDVAAAGYEAKNGTEVHRRIVERLEALPGVRGVSFSAWAPMSGSSARSRIALPGPPPPGNVDMSVAVNSVEAGFFAAMGMPIMAGRDLSERDAASAPMVAVVNQAMAKKFFGDEDPVGRHFISHRASFARVPGPNDVEIIGVVRDAKYFDVRGPALPSVFFPFAQDPSGLQNFARANFVVRVSGELTPAMAAIREALHAVHPKLVPGDLRTEAEQSERLFRQERLFGRLSAFYAAFAVLLVCVGLYGLMSYAVIRRTREIGIRVALGALPARLCLRLVAESMRPVLAGIVLGVGASVAAVRLVAHLLFDLSPFDPLAYGAAAMVMIGVALLACWLPALRATKVDPAITLRAE